MKGVVLAGGTRSRLFPLTKISFLEGWSDRGTFSSLLRAANLVAPRAGRNRSPEPVPDRLWQGAARA